MDTSIQKYLAFVTVIEYGSFSKAATILNYSQSGVSRMIADLEKEWGFQLLKRNKFGISLTNEGKTLLPFAKQLINDYKELKDKVNEINGLQTGIIRIATFSSVATYWIPNIIKAFQKDYPQIQFEILIGEYDEIEDWVLKGRADCGFLLLPTLPEFDTIFLEQDQFVAVLPEDHPKRELDIIPIKLFCEEPCILLEKETKSEINRAFEKYNLEPNTKYTTWDDYAAMSLVEKGLGISLLPNLILKRNSYKIITKPIDKPIIRDIGLAYDRKNFQSLAFKKFLTYLDDRYDVENN